MIVRYNVKFWDSDESVTREEGGITVGKDYGEAVNRIVDFYGKEDIISLSVYACDDILTDEDLMEFQKEK